ncbi:MAG: glycosyltransferase [Nitrosopumilaceae archaeon]
MSNPNHKEKYESRSFTDSKKSFGVKKIQNRNSEKLQSFKNPKKIRTDPVQIILAAAIFGFLSLAIFFLIGPISMFAMAIGGGLAVYNYVNLASKKFLEKRKGFRSPSVLFVVLMGSPFLLGGLIAYEGFTLLEAPWRIILLWGMTVSFWTTMLFVPMSILSKRRELLLPDLVHYPKISVIIPAYNEEKVIQDTIESVIEAKYPSKQIIVVDDGSTDRTLEIAKKYKSQITVLHKLNGGKASALNYGIVYAKAEIIVIVDADTIIGRRSLEDLVKGFAKDENIAAVAGNVKVRNRVNWITKCQALEHIAGINIVRRAFDEFRSVTIVPGALGAFRKGLVSGSNAYGHETIVEDFDQTIKLLKTGLVTQGSVKSVAYTEAPSTFKDYVKQRKRWFRGNIQVLKRHSDAFTNPRYGNLQKLAIPFLFLGMIITPIIGFVSMTNVVFGVLMGDVIWVLEVVAIFVVVHVLMTALAIRIDNENTKLLVYSPFLLFGYKQIVDFLLLRALFEQVTGRKAKWTSAKRTGTKRTGV